MPRLSARSEDLWAPIACICRQPPCAGTVIRLGNESGFLILVSSRALPIGTIIEAPRDETWGGQRFRLSAAATAEEWIARSLQIGHSPACAAQGNAKGLVFYRAVTD